MGKLLEATRSTCLTAEFRLSYTADENGVVYDVQYQGEPSYPPPPPGGYGPYKGPGAYPGPKPGGYGAPAPAPVYVPES